MPIPGSMTDTWRVHWEGALICPGAVLGAHIEVDTATAREFDGVADEVGDYLP
jgi:hypothetical protein